MLIENVWSRSSTIALAKEGCTICFGGGMVTGHREHPCKCVLRQIFRACYRKFRACANSTPSVGGGIRLVSLSKMNSNDNRNSAACGASSRRRFGYPKSEYVADFVAVARRTLGADSIGFGVFRLHFEQGRDWKVCTRRLGINRGCFFHEVYRVEEKLGRAFREVQPHALFPIDEYFRGTTRRGH